MSYPRLARFAAPAAARSEVWRTVTGALTVGVVSWVAVFGVLGMIGSRLSDLDFARLVTSIARAGSPEGVSMLLATFAPMVMAVIFVVQVFHKRAVATLLGAGALRDFLRVFGPLIGLALVLVPLAVLDKNVGRSVPLETVLRWLPIALPLLAVQVAAEELLFRGYLLQQFAARFRSPWLWMVLPSAVFGALHYAPSDYGSTAIFMALWAMGFGCLASDLTARAGNIGPALAFHLANNISAMFLVGLYGQLDGLSLYTIVINLRDPAALAPYLAIDSLMMVTSWLLARIMLRL